MTSESDIRHGRRCVFRLHLHLVFVAKYGRRVFDARAIEVLRDIFADVCSDVQATLVETDGEDDHVHLLVEYSPKLSVSSLVNSLKGPQGCFQSPARQQRPDIRQRYWKGVLWSPSLLVF
jgi:putative transposase